MKREKPRYINMYRAGIFGILGGIFCLPFSAALWLWFRFAKPLAGKPDGFGIKAVVTGVLLLAYTFLLLLTCVLFLVKGIRFLKAGRGRPFRELSFEVSVLWKIFFFFCSGIAVLLLWSSIGERQGAPAVVTLQILLTAWILFVCVDERRAYKRYRLETHTASRRALYEDGRV